MDAKDSSVYQLVTQSWLSMEIFFLLRYRITFLSFPSFLMNRQFISAVSVCLFVSLLHGLRRYLLHFERTAVAHRNRPTEMIFFLFFLLSIICFILLTIFSC